MLQIVWSIVAAFLGIQTDTNLDHDDEQIETYGFMPYIVVGIVLTIMFVLIIYGLVQLGLSFV